MTIRGCPVLPRVIVLPRVPLQYERNRRRVFPKALNIFKKKVFRCLRLTSTYIITPIYEEHIAPERSTV